VHSPDLHWSSCGVAFGVLVLVIHPNFVVVGQISILRSDVCLNVCILVTR